MSLRRLLPSVTALLTLLAAPTVSALAPQAGEAPVQRPSVPAPPALPPAPAEPEPVVPETEPTTPENHLQMQAEPKAAAWEPTEPEATSPAIPSAPASMTGDDPSGAKSTGSDISPPETPSPGLALDPVGNGWKRDYVRVRQPRFRGTGLMATVGSLYATALLFQLGDLALCGNCATGLLERGFLGTALVLAPIGAAKRGRSDAYRDAASRRPSRRTGGMIIGGFSLAAVGAAVGIANEVMWWQCMANGTGPYVVEDEWVACRYGAGRAALDLGAAATTAGLSMAAWGLRYRHDARVYEHARVTVAPSFTRTYAGVTMAGSF